MAVSHFTDNKFAISCFTRKKTFLYDQIVLLWLRTTAKELFCSMSSPFSRFLFLVLWKGNRVLDSSLFRSWGSAPSLSSEESSLYSESWSASEIPDEDPYFLSSSCGTSLPQFTVNNQHPILVSQIIIIKNHSSWRLPKSHFTRNRKVISQFTGNKASNSQFTEIPFTALLVISMHCKTEWLWELQTWSHKWICFIFFSSLLL